MSTFDPDTIAREIDRAARRGDTRRVRELNRLADQQTSPEQAARDADMLAGIAANIRAVL